MPSDGVLVLFKTQTSMNEIGTQLRYRLACLFDSRSKGKSSMEDGEDDANIFQMHG
jgi:hypothetical protein